MRYRSLPLLPLLILALLPASLRADEFFCPLGEPVSAPIGDGVTLHTCMWKKQDGVTIRTGPLQLNRNGIVILELRTNFNGDLHGRYRAWSDAGELTDQGNYDNGLKQGPWLETDANGSKKILHYRDGILITK